MKKSLHNLFLLSRDKPAALVLIFIGLIALANYYSWWLRDDRLASPLLAVGFITALIYGICQLVSSWAVYLGAQRRKVKRHKTPNDITIDVFLTVYKEDPVMIERTLSAACAMQGNHQTWLLDDGNDPELESLARRVGAGYLTRAGSKDAKAGNVNAALTKTTGDIIVIFDIDHVPQPDFLERSISLFADPKLGFVQVMPTFSNTSDSWIARAAAESSLDFYNPTSMGMDGLNSVTKMGSNSLIRREALETIGGYQAGLAEDLATSISLHSKGWYSAYVAEPLAPGLVPPDLAAWFTQQFKWARGVFEVLVKVYPQKFTQLTWGQRVAYMVRMTKYWIGLVVSIHLLLTVGILFSGDAARQIGFGNYLLHLFPVAFMEVVIRQFHLRKWHHPSVMISSQWRAVMLVYTTWPVYTLAWLMAMFRIPLKFRPTPKDQADQINPTWIIPQLLILILMGLGLIYTMDNFHAALSWTILIVPAFTIGQTVSHVGLLSDLFRVRQIKQMTATTNPESINEKTPSTTA
ncbi:MAG: cellulose synthase catalytic subunit [Chloroflexota bacterium]